MDRNIKGFEEDETTGVALREGGVDRNTSRGCRIARRDLSPSARGAWIATAGPWRRGGHTFVALREGGVDRNNEDPNVRVRR